MRVSMTGVRRFTDVAFLVATLTLAGCDDGGGPSRVYFSMSNLDGCVKSYLSIDLSAGGSVISRLPDGSPDCTLAPELAAQGCQLILEDHGETLATEVSGCRIFGVHNLFSCLYEHADLDVLNTVEGADCGCLTHDYSCYVNGICDHCASLGSDRSGCEKCENELDDDDDGDVDCDDEDCELTDECGYGRSTITCQESSTTSTTSTSTTISSMLDPLQDQMTLVPQD